MDDQSSFSIIENSVCNKCKHLLYLEIDTNLELIDEQGNLIDIAPDQFICLLTGRDIITSIIKCNQFKNKVLESIIFKNPYNN